MVLHFQALDFQAPASPAFGGRLGPGRHEQQPEQRHWRRRRRRHHDDTTRLCPGLQQRPGFGISRGERILGDARPRIGRHDPAAAAGCHPPRECVVQELRQEVQQRERLVAVLSDGTLCQLSCRQRSERHWLRAFPATQPGPKADVVGQEHHRSR